MPYFHLHRALAPLAGASHLFLRVAGRVRNALSRIMRAGGGLLLVGSLLAVSQLFLARSAEAQQFTVSPASFAENVGTAKVLITCTRTIGSCISVRWATKNGTATAGTDFTTTTGERTTTNRIAGGDSAEVNIPITDDSNAEAAEHFFLTLTFFDGSPAVDHEITIEASDSAGASDVPFTVSPDSFAEGVGTANVTVTYTGSTLQRYQISTKDGTAEAGAGKDYTSTTRGGAFSPVNPALTVPIPINDDSAQENDEIFFVVVNGVDHPITIEANDASTSVSPASFAESAGSARITITNNGPNAPLTFATKDGTAKAGSNGDYIAIASMTTPSIVSGSNAVVNVTINTDNVREPDEHFFLTVNGFDHRITITDASPAPTLTVSPGSTFTNENVGSFVYTVRLAANPPIIEDVTVRCYTRDFRSTVPDVQPHPGDDFTLVDETLTFMPGGATSQTCAIPIIDDMLNEGAEAIAVRFGDPTGGAVIAGANAGCCLLAINLSITDNDDPPVVSVAATSTTVSEGTATIEVAVNLSAAVGKSDIVIGYRLSGTATPGYGATRTAGSEEDYTVSYVEKGTSGFPDETVRGTKTFLGSDLTSGTGEMVIVRGESSKTFTIHVHDDQLKELTETIVFELIQNTGSPQDTSTQFATLHSTNSSVTLHLQSDETGIVSLTSADTRFVEGRNARVLAELDLDGTASGRSGPFDVTLVGSGDTADAGDHGTPTTPATVTEGAPTAIEIPLTADGTPEPDETITVTIADSRDSRHAASATFTIVDDGDPSLVTLPAGADPRADEGGEVEFVVMYEPPGASANRSETFAVSVAPGTASAEDYGAPSSTSVTLAEGTPQTITVPVLEDDLNELDETFDLVLAGQGGPPNGTSAEMRLQGTISADKESVTLKLRQEGRDTDFADDLRVDEGGGRGEEGPVTVTFEAALDLDGTPSGRSADIEVALFDGTATLGEDYRDDDGVDGSIFTLTETTRPSRTFRIVFPDDEESEGAEHFVIELQDPGGVSFRNEFRVSIDDNDGPDPILREIGRHAVARAEALIENQPRLIPMLRDPGARASEFLLRATDEGVDAAGGGFRAETLWGAATLSRTADERGEHEHLLATLGAHARISERLHLGGMLQFDRSGTKPGGLVDSGEIRGSGWMAGPYFAMRDGSRPLYFEGRLLYGRVSNDVDALVMEGGNPRSASFGSERWLAQARVEGTYRFESGATLVPLADLSHVRDVMEAFRASDDPDKLIDGQTIAVSKLQVGAELEIPVAAARGDLLFRPGLRFVVSDANPGAFAREEDGRIGLRSRGRIDFGIDYRFDDDLVLGFRSFYSGLGRKELESYGAGLDLRLEF